MQAEVINIGDELLIGQVVNTNASWMARKLQISGISIRKNTVIRDEKQEILEALDAAGTNSDVVLITGGLGPTRDDVTKHALAEFFGSKLVFNEEVFSDIERMFGQRERKINELNRKQAEVPENCIPIRNKNGTAPGMWFEKDGCVYISLPGVPYEMKPMMKEFILPRLRKRFGIKPVVYKTILTMGMGESDLAQKIEPWEDSLPGHFSLAYLPQPAIVRLRVSAKGDDKKKLLHEIDEQIGKLRELIQDMIFGYDDQTLPGVVGELLRNKGKTLSTAESCTGGYLAHLITGIPGSSDYYTGSVISYSNRIKEDHLGVEKELLKQKGAVSREVVTAMAEGVRRKFSTDFALSTSGIAGPAGGSPEKPVGTVWIGLASEDGTTSGLFHFGDNRERNIHVSALHALYMLWRKLA